MHSALGGLTSMAVRAPDFALCDLRIEPRQTVAARHQPGHFAGLVAHVIEIEDRRVTLATIDAPSLCEQ